LSSLAVNGRHRFLCQIFGHSQWVTVGLPAWRCR
jgi:hypothetical protein